ncbi:MAG: hypothetical protein J7K75_05435 [Desulfuromonas sp.]|nr:hypothetical protein [Desulfuromonas sp.]
MRQRCIHFAMITVAIICLIQVIQPGLSLAVISGPCSNCHTMHNSQDSDPLNAGTPNAGLLRETCFGCHAQGASTPTVMMGPNKVPQVMHSGANDLAGGNFGYITGVAGGGAADNKGHNIAALTGRDDTLFAPPALSTVIIGLTLIPSAALLLEPDVME